MKIVGIMLVRNEDRFVERAIRNAISFCDEFLVCDNDSTDGTSGILERLRDEFPATLKIRRTSNTGDSHDMIAPFAGSDTWIFGVDGDEIYDPAGLRRMRIRLESGEFSKWWVVFGNVLNVTSLDLDREEASGHLAPPCRSMTKLYNFAAIDSWTGRIIERLHGGVIRFKQDFDESLRLNLHESEAWSDADFRCLHLCFLPRSSKDNSDASSRRNIMDRHDRSVGKMIARVRNWISGKPQQDWKQQKYARGPLVTQPVGAFLAQDS